MRTTLLALLACLPACLATPTTDHDAAIGAVIDDWNHAWTTADHVLAASGYDEAAKFTNAFGFQRTGRVAIADYLEEVFQLDFVMAGKSREVAREIEYLHPDVALVWSRVEREGQQTAAGEDIGTRQTSHLRVFERKAGEWVIVSHLISDARATARPRH